MPESVNRVLTREPVSTAGAWADVKVLDSAQGEGWRKVFASLDKYLS